MGKKFISSDEAVEAKCQHTTPCSDCPWRRDSLNGWLGGASPQEWIQVAHADVVVPCHTLNGAQCAGIAVYRANVCKMAYEPNLKLPANRELVFALPVQFLEHHSKIPDDRE